MREGTKNKQEHILVCLSTAPSNARIIRTAASMANAFGSRFTALFVETPDFSVATEENKNRLFANQQMARKLGAQIETVFGDDVPHLIAEYARLSGVTQIVLGRSVVTRRHFWGKPTLTEQLLAYAPEIDIHIIPDKTADTPYYPRRVYTYSSADVLKNTAKSALILVGATVLSLLFHRLGFTDSNIIMVYILGVLLTSIVTNHQLYSLVSSIASVFIFNYLFTLPRFSLAAYGTGYPVTFFVMFLTAYITGTFAIRYKEQARQSARIAQRTRILLDTDQLLSKAKGKEQILRAAAQQIKKLLGRSIVMFDAVEGELVEPQFFPMNEKDDSAGSWRQELDTAKWVLEHNHAAGATTKTMPCAEYLYLALRVSERVYGVVGIEAKEKPLDAFEHGMLLSILGECALALENDKNAREKEEAAILVKGEQLRANLLRTISHDLRTPLTSISGHASNLLSSGDSFDADTKRQIYTDIYEDSVWLTGLVENILYATRIEEGRMTLSTSTELLEEIVREAVRHVSGKTGACSVETDCADELLLVRVDARMIVQVIVNIVDNAVKHMPQGGEIRICAGRSGEMARISVYDCGPGVPNEEKERIFEKFYCGTNRIADNRRSLGLGLYLSRAIVEAHGGVIGVKDNQPHGAVFHFTLPLEEMTYEQNADTCG